MPATMQKVAQISNFMIMNKSYLTNTNKMLTKHPSLKKEMRKDTKMSSIKMRSLKVSRG